MGREKQGYRDVMAQLNDAFPDKGMLTPGEVASFLGVSQDTFTRMRKAGTIRLNDTLGRVTKADLARQVCI